MEIMAKYQVHMFLWVIFDVVGVSPDRFSHYAPIEPDSVAPIQGHLDILASITGLRLRISPYK
jgi:hypothetical protein